MAWIGHFNNLHSPCLYFTLYRESDNAEFVFEGILDTGFTGFIQIPLIYATILGTNVSKCAIGKTTLASGKVENNWLKQMRVTVEGETVSGHCHITQHPNSPTLIGMEFLRKFDRVLVVSSKQGILLVEESKSIVR